MPGKRALNVVYPLLILAGIAVACGPTPARPSDSGGTGQASTGTGPKTLVLGVRYELPDIVPKIPTQTTSDTTKRLFSASLAYFDSYRSASLPQNLTQAQRDFFGAHTYQRTDDGNGPFVHTDWHSLLRK